MSRVPPGEAILRPPAADIPTQAPPPSLIELKQVVKNYTGPAGEVHALRGVDLRIAGGEFVAVMGKSGAGKSTLVNMITGIDHPDAGEVWIAGVSVHAMNEDRLARWRGQTMGVVFQFFQLLPSISLLQNVVMPMEFLGMHTPLERRERALALLEQVGLAGHTHKRPSEISGGQQQRVAVARALAADPPVIVADEPTGNLDSRTTAEILDLFNELAAAGKTLLVVTHEKSVAARAARRVLLVDGKVAAA